MTKAKRGGKVFVDWSQNASFKTTVNVYSLRAMERPTVSTPLTWDEVSDIADGEAVAFTSDEVLARVDDAGRSLRRRADARAGAAALMHRIVIVGGGFAGLRAARALAKAGGAQITLIDRTNHFVFQPLLYQVATGLLSGGQISPALRGMFRKFPQVRVLLGEVEGFDLDRGGWYACTPSTCSRLEYDTLILAAGATHSYFGRDDWAVLAPGMKSVDDANRLRSMILGAFELAEAAETAQERLAWMTFAIVGAGPTGVEMAGQVAELAQRILQSEYRSVDTSQARIVLLDSNQRVLKTFPEPLSARAEQRPALARDRRPAGRAGGGHRPRGPRRAGRRRAGPDHGQDRDLGRGREGLAARCGARRGRAGRGRARRGLARAHAAGAPRGVRDRRHGLRPGRPGGRAGRDPGRGVRRVGDRGAAGGRLSGRGRSATRTRARWRRSGAGGRSSTPGKLQLTGGVAYAVWGVVHIAYLTRWEDRLEAVWRWAVTLLGGRRRERLISIVSLVPETTARNVILELRRRRAERLDQAER